MAKVDLSIAIGGAAGQGIATPGDILARIFVRRGSAPECLQRLSVDRAWRPYFSHAPHQRRAGA